MFASFQYKGKTVKADLNQPIDISIPLRAGKINVNAWYVQPMTIEPVRTELFTGSVVEGGTVNFRDIAFNPHGNGTHTECVGHIAEVVHSINDSLTNGFSVATLVTVNCRVLESDEGDCRKKGDSIIELSHLEGVIDSESTSIIIRTTPNTEGKLDLQYSNSNPPYLCHKAAEALRLAGIKHLLIDLPSVDREQDNGLMLSHKAFWNYPSNPVMDATITELIYVPDAVEDGDYLLNIQIAPFVNDASPSKPLLYPISE